MGQSQIKNEVEYDKINDGIFLELINFKKRNKKSLYN